MRQIASQSISTLLLNLSKPFLCSEFQFHAPLKIGQEHIWSWSIYLRTQKCQQSFFVYTRPVRTLEAQQQMRNLSSQFCIERFRKFLTIVLRQGLWLYEKLIYL